VELGRNVTHELGLTVIIIIHTKKKRLRMFLKVIFLDCGKLANERVIFDLIFKYGD
jgi:ABC-type thiamine transport system ATPase subunit